MRGDAYDCAKANVLVNNEPGSRNARALSFAGIIFLFGGAYEQKELERKNK